MSSNAAASTSWSSLGNEGLLAPYAELPTPDITFTNVKDLFARFTKTKDEGGDCVVVGEASLEQFLALRSERDRLDSHLRLFYLAEHQMIIVTIPSFEHENLHQYFSFQIYASMNRMGIRWSSTANQTFSSSGAGTASACEGDTNGRPIPERMGKADWPTIVVEAGYTQSLQSLRTKMASWFSVSKHDIKVVLLAKAYPADNSKRIRIEQWQERPAAGSRPGAIARITSYQPTCMQTIDIAWAGSVLYDQATVAQKRDHGLYRVSRGPLRLAFECLFLRPPTAPRETDVVFTDSMLQHYASLVWAS